MKGISRMIIENKIKNELKKANKGLSEKELYQKLDTTKTRQQIRTCLQRLVEKEQVKTEKRQNDTTIYQR